MGFILRQQSAEDCSDALITVNNGPQCLLLFRENTFKKREGLDREPIARAAIESVFVFA